MIAHEHVLSMRLAANLIEIVVQSCLVVIAADLVSGIGHWFEDAYGRPEFPITGYWITQKNILHHHNPRYFTKNNWWQSNWDLTCLAILIVLVAWKLGALTWHVWLFAALGANANQIHKWAHCTPRENGRIITFLQRCHLLQSANHHGRHHTNPKDSNYCVITDFLNPILDGARVWDGLEWILAHTLGLRRRVDESVRVVSSTGNSEVQLPVSTSALATKP